MSEWINTPEMDSTDVCMFNMFGDRTETATHAAYVTIDSVAGYNWFINELEEANLPTTGLRCVVGSFELSGDRWHNL